MSLLQAVLDASKRLPSPSGAAPSADDGLLDVAQRSFRLALLQALDKAQGATGPASTVVPARPVTPPPIAPAPVPPRDPALPAPPPLPAIAEAFRPTRSVDEGEVIRRSADRAGIDPALLRALRSVENGGPGREFGVLSVPAPTYEDQARVAAESIRRSMERFEQSGRRAIDADGRYTREFIEFFSSRYAPVGAPNDPTGLNRHHARNLARLYARALPKE